MQAKDKFRKSICIIVTVLLAITIIPVGRAPGTPYTVRTHVTLDGSPVSGATVKVTLTKPNPDISGYATYIGGGDYDVNLGNSPYDGHWLNGDHVRVDVTYGGYYGEDTGVINMAMGYTYFEINITSSPNRVYVDDDFNSSTPGWQYDCFSVIQDGIDAVAENGTVYVSNGTYYENVVVNKTIDLIGENRNGTIIDGGGVGDTVHVYASRVFISNLTMQNCGKSNAQYDASLDLGGNSYCQIENCNFFLPGLGIFIQGNYNVFRNCNVSAGSRMMFGSNYNTMYNCVFPGPERATRFGPYAVGNNLINCTFMTHICWCGAGTASYHRIINCTFKNIDFSEGAIQISGGGEKNTIQNCVFANCSYGIFTSTWAKFRNSIICNNVFINCSYGIYIQSSSSSNNQIYHNNFINNACNAYDISFNIWYNDTLQEGNYWSDFDEPSEGAYDNNSDGIVDSPYYISGGSNVDRYPLMYQYNYGLVACWHFDEGSGSIVYDSSGNGNDGTVHGATWTSGISGSSLSFDGTNDYVEVHHSGDIDLNNEFTIETWVCLSASFSHNGNILGKESNPNFGYYLWIDQSRRVHFGFNRGGAEVVSATTIDIEKWYCIAGVWNGNKLIIYIDGRMDANSSFSDNPIQNPNPLYIGFTSAPWATYHYFKGTIDEVCIYNRALSAGEIQQHYDKYAGYYYDNFESGTLNKWNIIRGDWEVITEPSGNHIAHLSRSSEWRRILISKEEISTDIIIQAKVKGTTYTGDVADTSIGFYANDSGNDFYWIMLGGGFGAHNKYLSLGKTINNTEYIIAENLSIETSNNVWYNVKIRLENSNIFAKIWEINSVEPSNWQIFYMNASRFGNYLIIGTDAGQDDEEFWFDNISITNITTVPFIVYVDDDFNSSTPSWQYDHFNIIQDGIDAVAENGTVYVFNGTYYENVVINKTTNLIGEDRNGTIIDGNNINDVIRIEKNNISISNFTIRNSRGFPNACIKVYSSNNTIYNCDISNTNGDYGIRLENLSNSCNNTIYNCNIYHNKLDGVFFGSTCNFNVIYNCSLHSNGYDGIHMYRPTHNTVLNCSVSNNNDDGIQLNWPSNITISNCNISYNADDGIIIHYSNHNRINACTILHNNNDGIHMDYSDNNIITKNNISNNNKDGIRMIYSDANIITSNNITNNKGAGIHPSSHNNNNIIANNEIIDNDCAGIGIWHSSSDNIITDNNIDNNNWGIRILYLSNNNTIKNNTISNNYEYGVEIYSSINSLTYNNYFNNTNNAYDDGNNIWNISKTPGTNIIGGSYLGGNYWSDYAGVDTDGDGLGDTNLPYNCSGNIQNGGDYLPLVFSSAAPSIVYVDDDYNSSILGWQYDHFNVIQDGIDAVAENGTVYVLNGTYYENVVVNKTVNLVGEDRDGTIIQSKIPNNHVLEIIANYTKVGSLTVNGSTNGYGIYLNNVSNCNICNTKSTNSYRGIDLHYSSRNNIKSNICFNDVHGGISLWYSSHNYIVDNIGMDNAMAIELKESNYNYVFGNTCYSIEYGIQVWGSSFNYISNNIVSRNESGEYTDRGINFDAFSMYNTVQDNDIWGNKYGVFFWQNCDNNIISNNNIWNNSYGIYFETWGGSSTNNSFYHNNFVNNFVQAYDSYHNFYDSGYPSGGNYWDDYAGVDTDGDGLGDTNLPYNSSGNIQNGGDWYPLVTPNYAPTADFSYSPSNPTDLEIIAFTDSSSDSDGSIVNWTWNFGDGAVSYQQNPSHQYADDGTYNVTLVVTDDDGATDSTFKHITVSNVPPTANFSYSFMNKQTIAFTDGSVDNDGSIVNWSWTFGDAHISYEKNPTHHYLDDGVYNVTLTITDDDGATDSVSKGILIDTVPPWTEIWVNGIMGKDDWYISDYVIIAFMAHDSDSGVDYTMYRLDNKDWKKYNSALGIWQNGEHTIEYYSVDNAGNIEDIKSYSFKIDNKPPEVEVLYPNGGEILNGTVVIEWNATDNIDTDLHVNIKYSDDAGSTWHAIATGESNDGTYEWDTSGLSDGTDYLIKISTSDEAGNSGSDTSDRTFTIHNHIAPPSVSIVKPRGHLYIGDREIMPLPGNTTIIWGAITIEANAESGTGIEKVEF